MAYASLLSLMRSIDEAHDPPVRNNNLAAFLRKNLTESQLRDKIVFLQEFLKSYSHIRWRGMKILEEQIRHAADSAEDVFDSHMVDFTLAESTIQRKEAAILFCVDIEFVTAEIGFIVGEATKIKENGELEDQGFMFSGADGPLRDYSVAEDAAVVGFDEVFEQIMDEITRQQKARRQTFSIVGMGGIGKTTLAKKIYTSSLAKYHFDSRAWATISQDYNVPEVVLSLLHDIGILTDQTSLEEEEREKGLVASDDVMSQRDDKCDLFRSLFGRRYLIVLDDVWNIQIWDEVKRYFPNNDNGSCIIVTTRQSNLASQLATGEPYPISPLKADESWELLRKHVFGDEEFPRELEEIGKGILKKCKGLPLAIIVVGGLLSKTNRSRESWEHVVEFMNTLNYEDDDYCLNMLYLSYIHLPIHLKPCFLYMGIFLKNNYVKISKLIKLWVSEGFLIQRKSKTLEDVAEEYLQDLILACPVGFQGELKGCRMHDLVRDMCLREARKENFFNVRTNAAVISPGMKSERRFIIQPHQENIYCRDNSAFQLPSAAHVRTFICNDDQHPMQEVIAKCRLLKILDTTDKLSTEDIAQLANSRYLAFKMDSALHGVFPPSISRLRNLQTLIVESCQSTPVVLPFAIWGMSQLRHLKCSLVCMPDPEDAQVSQQDLYVLENLQTLSQVLNLRTTQDTVRRIPNVKKLKLFCEHSSVHGLKWSSFCLNNLIHLRRLESLVLTCVAGEIISSGELNFPDSLKKLTLLCCKFHWDDIGVIGSLPNLQVLILRKDAFDGQEWKPREGDFQELKCLYISSTNLENWHAEREHFQKLETLALLGCRKLKKIPPEIGEIPTLKLISLCSCNYSADDSARKILQEQRDYGNYYLNVSVSSGTGFDEKLPIVPPLHDGLSKWLKRLKADLEDRGNLPNLESTRLNRLVTCLNRKIKQLEHWGNLPDPISTSLNQLIEGLENGGYIDGTVWTRLNLLLKEVDRWGNILDPQWEGEDPELLEGSSSPFLEGSSLHFSEWLFSGTD